MRPNHIITSGCGGRCVLFHVLDRWPLFLGNETCDRITPSPTAKWTSVWINPVTCYDDIGYTNTRNALFPHSPAFPLVRFINVIIKFLLSIFDAPALLIFPPRPPTALQLSNSVFLWLALRGGPSRTRLEAIILLLLYDFLSFRNFFVRVRQRWAAQRHLNFFFNIFYCWLLAKEWTKPPQALAR